MYFQYTMNIILNILKINEKITAPVRNPRYIYRVGSGCWGRVVKVRSFYYCIKMEIFCKNGFKLIILTL